MSASVLRRRLRVEALFAPVDAASLGAFRVLFGGLMLWEVSRFYQHGWIERYYIQPERHFTYLWFEWVRPLPAVGMHAVFGALGLAAALVMVGLFTRPAAALFAVLWAYVFLLEQARYLNHFYLIALLAALLAFVHPGRWAALDTRFARPRPPETVPFWQLALLRAQLGLVYFYAGVAKLNPDWLLRGEPVRTWLHERTHFPLFGPLLAQEWTVWLIAWGGVAFDLGIPFLLLHRRTRGLAVAVAFAFHSTNDYLFQIGVFPYLAMAGTLLFLDPGWPRRLLRDSGLPSPTLSPAERLSPPTPNRAAVAAAGVYLAVQVLLPLRHWLYPGDVNWTEEGHRFSWRMKLRAREARLQVRLRDPATGREWTVDPRPLYTDWQFAAASHRPDMLLQMAHHIRDAEGARGVAGAEVYLRVRCSLNGAPEADLIDADCDLAAQAPTLWPAAWIRQAPVADQPRARESTP